ncbi:hypothetical protein KEM48_002745 [Puccinia striiformis f. sp. tritici PST-130]|nr:hypothetical protein KEM48_002745 [Puccinia striiformis f. sp. tritici PST-130]
MAATKTRQPVGINCILALDRVREEFDLITKELARALNWAASWYNGMCCNMGYLKARKSISNDDRGKVWSRGEGYVNCTRTQQTYIETWINGTRVGSGVAWLTAWCKLVVALDNTEEEAIMQVHVGNGEEIVSMRPGGAKGDNKADEDSDTAEVGDDTAMGDNETKPAHEV